MAAMTHSMQARTLQAMDCEQGSFYRTPAGRLVRITQRAENSNVCIEYLGKYGLGWQTMWLPSDAPLVPAPEFSDFPEPDQEDVHYGFQVPQPD
ncbi:MAG: hypothetical protein GXP54_13010 [Deltaproteobacteria bacterium]|nr:hypothetical protein [Deltaproteobacteria bacterium]